MSTKIKRTAGNICSGNEYVSYPKKEVVEHFKAILKSYQFIKHYFILFITYIFNPSLTTLKIHPNEDLIFNDLLNINAFISLFVLLDIHDIYLYYSLIAQFLLIYIILNSYYEINFMNLFDYFNKLILYNEVFLISLNNIPIIKLNTIKTRKKREKKNKAENIFFTNKKRMKTQNFSSNGENGFFELNNVTTNTDKLIDDRKIENDDNIIIIKQRNKGNKFLIRNINLLRYYIEIIKYIILLNISNNIVENNKISLIEYNSYNITLKIKGTGTKKIFSNYNFPSDSYPDEVYINGDKQNGNSTHSYNLNQTDNVIGLIWYNLISNCNHMFYECSDITEIDFSNFNTSNVDNMQCMFSLCSSLTSLNLSNFETSKVTRMNLMFYNCSSLTSLNLSNFNTSKADRTNQMFEGCTNLEYINMINFNENSLTNGFYYNMFKDVPDNIVVCIYQINIPLIYPQINNITCHIEDCSDDWKLKQNKFIEGTAQCDNNCPDTKSYEYNGQSVSECKNGNYTDENNIVKCKCELEKCFTCPTVAYNKGLCTKCNDNYYPMENDTLNLGEYINCYIETPTGYYFDANNSLYKKCYHTCETCEIKGDNEFHNCLKCNTDFNFEIHINNYINCYQNCSYYYYFDNDNNFFCTTNFSCPPEYPHLIENERKCVLEGIKAIENFINDIFNYEANEELTKEEEINKYNQILDKIESIFTSLNFDLTKIDKGEDQVISANKILITFTNYSGWNKSKKSRI